jgi:hypothetical protein
VATVRVPRHVLVDRLNADFQPEFDQKKILLKNEGQDYLFGFGM